jgi:hypothetical protein
MNYHPENSPETNELISEISKIETVDVWCKCCEGFTKMNAAYAKYLSGEINCCSKCRGSDRCNESCK